MTIATHFLCMDQNDPLVEYNSEEYRCQGVEYYIEEEIKFWKGVRFLEIHLTTNLNETEVTTICYDAARQYDPKDLQGFFKRLYQVMFQSNVGPRLPTFIMVYGITEFKSLLENNSNMY